MAFFNSPGVKISEVDLSTTIPTEGVSDAAFVGTGFTWGPVDTAVTVSSEKELVRIFGKPTKGNKDWFTAASFLAYGGDLQIIRQEKEPKWAGDTAAGSIGEVTSEGGVAVTGADTVGQTVTILKDAPIGSYQITISEIDSGAIEGQAGFGDGVPTAATSTITENVVFIDSKGVIFTVTGSDGSVAISNVTGNDNAVDYGLNVLTFSVDKVVTTTDGAATVNVVSASIVQGVVTLELTTNLVAGTVEALFYNAGGDGFLIGNIVTTAAQGDPSVNISDNISSKYAGTSGNSLSVTISDQVSGDSSYLTVSVSDDITVLETFEWLTSAENQDDFGKNTKLSDVVNEGSSYIVVSDTIGKGTYNLSGGSVGTGQVLDYSVFNDTEKYDVDLIVGGSATGKALECATARADCVAFVSATGLSSDSLNTKIATAKNGLTPDCFGFMDSGSKKMYDKYNDGFVEGIPLNGDIAGLCVRTDNTREPWYSPAGFNRGQLRNVVSLTYDPSQSDRDALYEANINPVSTFPGQGVVLFGDKTLQTKPSAFDRINVRRLFNIIEKTIKDVAKYSLFEFNDEFTRAQFRSIITPYLRDIQARRGITDFLIVCDDSNNPANVIDSNQFIGDIFIKPSRSVNFIQLNFVAVSTGVSFNEVVGAV